MKKKPQSRTISARGKTLWGKNIKAFYQLLRQIKAYVSTSSSPSLTSGNQWHKQFASRTPPPKFNRNDNIMFFGFFLFFFIKSGCIESIVDKSYLRGRTI